MDIQCASMMCFSKVELGQNERCYLVQTIPNLAKHAYQHPYALERGNYTMYTFCTYMYLLYVRAQNHLSYVYIKRLYIHKLLYREHKMLSRNFYIFCYCFLFYLYICFFRFHITGLLLSVTFHLFILLHLCQPSVTRDTLCIPQLVKRTFFPATQHLRGVKYLGLFH